MKRRRKAPFYWNFLLNSADGSRFGTAVCQGQPHMNRPVTILHQRFAGVGGHKPYLRQKAGHPEPPPGLHGDIQHGSRKRGALASSRCPTPRPRALLETTDRADRTRRDRPAPSSGTGGGGWWARQSNRAGNSTLPDAQPQREAGPARFCSASPRGLRFRTGDNTRAGWP